MIEQNEEIQSSKTPSPDDEHPRALLAADPVFQNLKSTQSHKDKLPEQPIADEPTIVPDVESGLRSAALDETSLYSGRSAFVKWLREMGQIGKIGKIEEIEEIASPAEALRRQGESMRHPGSDGDARIDPRPNVERSGLRHPGSAGDARIDPRPNVERSGMGAMRHPGSPGMLELIPTDSGIGEIAEMKDC